MTTSQQSPLTGLSIEAPACTVLEVGMPLSVKATSNGQGLKVVAEVRRSDGTFYVPFRQPIDAGASEPIVVPADALQVGDNEVVFVAQGEIISTEIARVPVTVVVPATGGATDRDNDCYTPRTGDCDDDDGAVNPAAEEVCGDGIDNDCDGASDFDEAVCIAACPDADGDGAKAKVCGGVDCDDTDVMVRPGAAELCNGRDDDCDGVYDESFDADGDSFVRCVDGTLPTRRTNGAPCPPGYATCPDCDDHDASVYPGPSETVSGACGNGILDAGEECEDGNATNGDGCDGTCVVECPPGDGAARIGAKLASNHHCYTLFTASSFSNMSEAFFNNANEQCVLQLGKKATLATLATAEEMALVNTNPLKDALKNLTSNTWIGANDVLVENEFHWLTGELLHSNVGVAPWGPGQPNDNGGEDCVTINGGGSFPNFSDASCVGAQAAALCELEAPMPRCPPP